MVLLTSAYHTLFTQQKWDTETNDDAGHGARLLQKHHETTAGRRIFTQYTTGGTTAPDNVQDFLQGITVSNPTNATYVFHVLLPAILLSMKGIPGFDFS